MKQMTQTPWYRLFQVKLLDPYRNKIIKIFPPPTPRHTKRPSLTICSGCSHGINVLHSIIRYEIYTYIFYDPKIVIL